MPIGAPAATTHRPHNPAARNLEAGMLLIGFGALLLLVSLFLTWYQPEIDAWEIFEVWDLVLAALAIAALVAVASRMGFGPARPSSWLIVPTVAAFVIVVYSIVNPPPLTRGVDGDPDTGLWLALAATLLMAIGAVLSVARISVAFAPGHAEGHGVQQGPGFAEPVHPAGPGGPVAPGAPVSPATPGGRTDPPTEATRRL